jgi:hypothetical protein
MTPPNGGQAPPGENPPPPLLSADHARRILAANVANIAKKAKEGKPLTTAEVELVRTASGHGEGPLGFAPNQVELAQALGVNRRTIQRWSRLDGCPGARSDGRYPIDEWRSWARTNGLRVSEVLDAGELKAEQLALQNEKLRHEIAVLRRVYVPARDVELLGARLGAAVRKVVTSLHLLAPSVAGMTVLEAEVLLKDKEDEIVAQLHTIDVGLEDLTTPALEEHEPPTTSLD